LTATFYYKIKEHLKSKKTTLNVTMKNQGGRWGIFGARESRSPIPGEPSKSLNPLTERALPTAISGEVGRWTKRGGDRGNRLLLRIPDPMNAHFAAGRMRMVDPAAAARGARGKSGLLGAAFDD
jgi:hypothetical protein